MNSIGILVAVGIALVAVFGGISVVTRIYNLDHIKAKTVGDGQHGTARWARPDEIKRTYKHIPYTPKQWRSQAQAGTTPTQDDGKPLPQGLVVGGNIGRNTVAFVDDSDVHALMIGAAGVGKTAYFLYPNLEYACASGMSFVTSDTKGDLYRTYGKIAEKYYGYKVSVIDLRNPTRSNGNNLLHLVNKYMDLWLAEPDNLAYKAKAEKYAKIISKTIITSGSDGNFGQNAFFYDAAEGLLTATILLVAEFCPPGTRHIVSVFKVIQELLAPSRIKGRSQFQVLLDKLPAEHKAKWFAGSALNSSEQAMASVMSTALSRLNAFLDSEMEQILCFDTAIDAESFCANKSALFLVMPEEDNTKYFMVSLIVQQLYREILAVADEQGGKLKNRVMFYLDEFGTIPKIESAEMMFSASRSRRLSIVAIIQSFAQLTKNYGKEGGEIIVDNTQVTVFGGFAPNSESAEILSKSLGTKTVQSGSVSMGKDQPSQSLQMMERALMTPDELKSLPKGTFIVTKTGFFPMQVHLKLFFEWGIQFDKDPYVVPEQGNRAVAYADKKQLERAIMEKYPPSQEQIQREAEEEQRRAERIGKSSKTNAMMNKPHTGSAGKRKQNHRKQVSFSEAYDLVQKGGMG
ncbi:MAG: type IV secretory system conjugative DNA transfer family protein [Clostridiales bacterium]|nr:type IV secretory system conjugative DNA transfer family protein [Clostridiales bacterium]